MPDNDSNFKKAFIEFYANDENSEDEIEEDGMTHFNEDYGVCLISLSDQSVVRISLICRMLANNAERIRIKMINCFSDVLRCSFTTLQSNELAKKVFIRQNTTRAAFISFISREIT